MTDIRAAYNLTKRALLAERTRDGHWEGYLSSSALSTATAVSALCAVSRTQLKVSGTLTPLRCLTPLVDGGARWLVEHQNGDGGWGDTTDSPSNLATTLLARAALAMADAAQASGGEIGRASWRERV